jgi:HEAT repeat protein
VRSAVADALGGIGLAAVPVLTDAATDKDTDPTLRELAIKALVRAELGAEHVVPTLIAALEDADPSIREFAVDALIERGSAAKDAAPALVELMIRENDDEGLPWKVTRGLLLKIGLDARAVPALIKALNNDQAVVRDFAADLLGEIGTEAATAVPALTKALEDPDEGVRASAADAIEKIAPGRLDDHRDAEARGLRQRRNR